ncbi:SIS domain-containing protein [Nocardioides campestrisoli]|uniref:SIS domain-containing protein n=1 Tax=Nocardioides campestrisoli TaxID=2736757 RepID=UPI0015E652A2|nr:SIS domain-containing protein [Nocardioides campestrisoli]
MGAWFDESRLDDPEVLATWDAVLRPLAESGARVRREMAGAAEVLPAAVAAALVGSRPRAVVAAGPDSRLLRAVLEPWCPVPFVAWPGAGLPGWVGSLDLVVVLAPEGSDHGSASAVSEAVRRGAQAVVACPPRSLVAEHAAGRWTTLFPMATGDQLASAVVMLEYLDQVQLGPRTDAEEVAGALDAVATSCSPHRDLAVNDAKMLAIALADTMPVVWGGSVLAARAARRVAESLRRATGTSAIAGVAENLLPVLEATRPRDVFDDPFADEGGERRPLLLVLDDGTEQELARAERDQLLQAASLRGIRTETVRCRDGLATEVARYASLVLHGRYAAAYLQCGLVQD